MINLSSTIITLSYETFTTYSFKISKFFELNKWAIDALLLYSSVKQKYLWSFLSFSVIISSK